MTLRQAAAMFGQTVQFLRIAHRTNPLKFPDYRSLVAPGIAATLAPTHTKICGWLNLFYKIMMSFEKCMNVLQPKMDMGAVRGDGGPAAGTRP